MTFPTEEDEALFGTVNRLISDKREEKRTAAPDIVMQLSKDEKRTALYEKCLPLVSGLTETTTKEQILISGLAGVGQKIYAPQPLFSESDRYAPVLPEDDHIRDSVELFMKIFPDSELGNVLFPEKYARSGSAPENSAGRSLTLSSAENRKGTHSSADTVSQGSSTAFEEALETLQSLDRCIDEHRGREFLCEGEARTISYEFYTKDEKGTLVCPFMEDWLKWWDDRAVSYEKYVRMKILLSSNGNEPDLERKTEKIHHFPIRKRV